MNRLRPVEIIVSFLFVLGLALPFVPIPGDGRTEMQVAFQAAGMSKPRQIHTHTGRAECVAMAHLLAYEDPANGRFTRVACLD